MGLDIDFNRHVHVNRYGYKTHRELRPEFPIVVRSPTLIASGKSVIVRSLEEFDRLIPDSHPEDRATVANGFARKPHALLECFPGR